MKKHSLEHDHHLYGPKVDCVSGTYFITIESNLKLRKVTEESAKIGRRDTTYDFPLFSTEEPDTSLITALKILDGRAIGGIVTRNRSCAHKARTTDFAPNPFLVTSYLPTSPREVSSDERRTIDFIWLVKTGRGQGMVGAIFRDLEGHLMVPLSELAFMTPFTEAALWCLRREGLDEIFVVR